MQLMQCYWLAESGMNHRTQKGASRCEPSCQLTANAFAGSSCPVCFAQEGLQVEAHSACTIASSVMYALACISTGVRSNLEMVHQQRNNDYKSGRLVQESEG